MALDPRELPIPDNFLDRVEAFARDLAYGVSVDEWTPAFVIMRHLDGREDWDTYGQQSYQKRFKDYLVRKWTVARLHPGSAFLEGLGFFSLQSNQREDQSEDTYNPSKHFEEILIYNRFILTSKAFFLLAKPIQSPKVIISYCHAESSALALLRQE